MTRTSLLGIGLLLGFANVASAQPFANPYGGGTGGFGTQGYGFSPNVMPNIYNPRTQPLSPYLNLSRGGNAGVNYYYGVRPGTVGGAGSFGQTPFLASGGSRAPNFPITYSDPDAVSLPEVERDKGYILPPAGHPVVYGNTLGYFPGGPGSRGMSSGGGIRPGIGSAQPGATPRR